MQCMQKSNADLILFNNYLFYCISWNKYTENNNLDGKNMIISYFYLENKGVRQKVMINLFCAVEGNTGTSCTYFSKWLVYVLVETFGEMWIRRSTHECRHSHYNVRIDDNEARHSKHSFLWLGTNLPTYLWELRDKRRTGWEYGRQDECTLHTLVLVLSHAVSTRM